MGRKLVVLSGRGRDDSAGNAGKIAELMGVPHVTVSPGIEKTANVIEEILLTEKQTCVIASARNLGEVFDTPQSRDILKRRISCEKQVLFIYGYGDSSTDAEIVKQLTNTSITAIRKNQWSRVKCQISGKFSSICQQLSSVNFDVDFDPHTVTFLVENNIRCGDVLVTLDGEPFFIRIAVGKGEVFLAGCSRIANVDEHVTQGNSLLPYFTSLIPLMMVLRHVYQAESWHNSTPRACFIIDDPLLRKSYGFIDYKKIVKTMEEKRFCTSIAFIPWNYRRTNKDVALLFRKHSNLLSLNIHGCDHTRAEFGSTDEKLLEQKATEALRRMWVHHNLSGVPFEKVMVFPQGVFSTVALRVLKSCGYLAAVNSTLYPVNAEGVSLSLKELLDVAVTKFSNVPLFIRRYPKNMAEAALDLFLGKPALLVEHHRYFQNGYYALSEMVDKLNSFDSQLEWSNLSKICSQTFLKRRNENGDIHVRFFTDQFQLHNDSDYSQNYILFRRNLDEEHLREVTINSSVADYTQETDWVKIPVCLDARQIAEVKIEYDKHDLVTVPFRPGRIQRTKITIRRRLCELRDNYVDKYRSF
jgi:hypothetical protein